jgi:hypothetical protein
MQTALDFDIPARARVGDPETSHEAADALNAHELSDLQAKVLAWFKSHKSGTDEQLERDPQFRDLAPSTARKRRSDLLEMGLIRDSGKRELNSRNRSMVVWEIV